MKCFQHDSSDAVAVCANCGRALCRDCIPSPSMSRIACSADCSAELLATTKTLQLLLDKSAQSARASAFYCYLTSALSAGAAAAAWYMLPSPFLIYFTAACAAVLGVAGYWYQRAARRHKVEP